MSDYSVTVRLQGFTRSQIKGRLEAAFGSPAAQEAQIVATGTLPDCYEACTANSHFGCVHWTDEDIEIKLRDLDIPKTQQIMASAKSAYALRHISDRMVELGMGGYRGGNIGGSKRRP